MEQAVSSHTTAKRHTSARARAVLSRSALIALGVALLPFVVFWAETLGLRVFFHHDVQYYFFPYHKLVVDIMKAGHVPLWNPHAFSGMPLLGDGQTAIFYPPNWLFWLLPPAHALTCVILTQFSIAGVGTWLYARHLRFGLLAATVAALTFMWSGFLVARVVHLSILAGAALIPAVFWSVDRLIERRTVGAFAIAAVTVALQAVAGHPQLPVYTALALGVYTLALIVQRWWRFRTWRAWLPVVQLAGVYVVGYLLAAIQLVPWIELARFSPRAAGASYQFVTNESLRSWDWILFLFPYAFGGMRITWLQSMPPWDLPVYLWERLGYVGLLPLMLAGIGVVHGWRMRQAVHASPDDPAYLQATRWWALIVVAGVAALIAAGSSTPFGYVVYLLPVVGRLRGYSRAVVLLSFAVALLAAYGVEQLRAAQRPVRSAWWSGALVLGSVLIVLCVVIVRNAPFVPNAPIHDQMLSAVLRPGNANAFVPLLLAVASAGVLWWAYTGLSWLKAALLLGVLLVDLLGLAATFNPTTAPAVFDRVPPSVQFLQRDEDLFRVANFVVEDKLPPHVAQSQLAISWSLPYGIDEINGFNSLQPRRYTDVLWGPAVGDVSYGFLTDQALLQPSHHLLTMLGVKYAVIQPQTKIVPPPEWEQVFVDTTVAIYRNPNWRGRAMFADWVAALPNDVSILETVRLSGFNGSRMALVEEALDLPAQQASEDTPADVEMERISPHALRIRTSTDVERFLIVSEMWFPGWKATLEDGTPLTIYRTNYLLRGLVVPPGEHTIRMEYQPMSAMIGAIITAGTAGGLVGVGVGRRMRRIK